MKKNNINLNAKSSASQTERILAHLLEGKAITPLEALELFGCLRLGARISDLRKGGVEIKSKFVTTSTGKHVKQYYLEG